MITKSKFFYGYWIVLVGFISSIMSSGLAYYGFSVLNKPIGDDFNWSRSTVTAAFLIYSLTVACGVFFVGRLTDRSGPRRVLLLGAIVMSMSLLLLSTTSAPWNFYLLYLALGIGAALMGQVAVSVSISNWFYRLRGTMQGIAFTGIGFGGLIMAPFLGNYLVPNIGWRGTYLVMGSMLGIIMLPLIIFVLKEHPRLKNLQAYGQEAAEAVDKGVAARTAASGLNLKKALLTPALWVILLTSLTYGMSITGPLQNQVGILGEQGISVVEAVVAIGIIGLFSGVGKFLFGYLCDYIDAKYATAISYVFMFSAIFVMIQARSIAHVWLYAVLLGLGQGGWAPNLAMLSSTYFGLKHYGAVLGAMYMSFFAGEAIAPMLAGLVYDQTASYRLILIIFATLSIISVPAIALIRKPKIASN